ncbi:MAG: YjdF family protein [bacterium]|nr:YjdF family protein [bacterium]
MDQVKDRCLVYFEDPFWVGVFEQCYENKISVSKVTFGPEPKDYQVYEFIRKQFYQLQFSPMLQMDAVKNNKINPKRMQREARKELANGGIGTKSQQALKEQQEQRKLERKEIRKKRSEREKEEHFLQKQQKRKQKHKGR